MNSHSSKVAAHKAEKATKDPLYKEGPQKNRRTEKTETGSGKRGLAIGRYSWRGKCAQGNLL